MNYFIKSTFFITICLIEIIFTQSIYNKHFYRRTSQTHQIAAIELGTPGWINKENINNTETILEETISPDQYFVGPGDQFAINIISSDGVFNFSLEVSPTGELLLPLIGLIKIDQLSLILAIEQIKILSNSKYENAKLDISLIKLKKY